MTSIYQKNTLTSLYTRWHSFTPRYIYRSKERFGHSLSPYLGLENNHISERLKPDLNPVLASFILLLISKLSFWTLV